MKLIISLLLVPLACKAGSHMGMKGPTGGPPMGPARMGAGPPMADNDGPMRVGNASPMPNNSEPSMARMAVGSQMRSMSPMGGNFPMLTTRTLSNAAPMLSGTIPPRAQPIMDMVRGTGDMMRREGARMFGAAASAGGGFFQTLQI